ncbi:hypothetical protein Tco_0478592 [Tanacetum coccineum]
MKKNRAKQMLKQSNNLNNHNNNISSTTSSTTTKHRRSDPRGSLKEEKKEVSAPRTPSGSPPSPPPSSPPQVGASGTLGTLSASGSSQLPPLPPPPSIGASGSDQLQGSKALSSSKPAASTHQSMAWTTFDTRFESTGFMAALELSSTRGGNSCRVRVGGFGLTADLRKDWWKPLPKEERPATPELAWTIPSSNKSDVVNNWASALATTYEPPTKNSLLAKTRDMTTFMS